MRFIRNQREKLQDLVLSLTLFGACQEGTAIGDRLKVTKLMFLASYSLFEQRIKGFSLNFYRYTHGPFTPEVYEIWEELAWMGLLAIEGGAKGELSLTPEGQKMADLVTGHLKGEPSCSPHLEQTRVIADAWSSVTTSELLNHVYSMVVRPIGYGHDLPLRDVPSNQRLTGILSERESRMSMAIPTDSLQEMFRTREMARAESVLPGSVMSGFEESLSVTNFLKPPRPARKFSSISELRAAGE